MSEITLWPARATDTHVAQTANALKQAIAARGAPCRITAGALFRTYGGPRPSQIGLVLRNRLEALSEAVGYEITWERLASHLPMWAIVGAKRA